MQIWFLCDVGFACQVGVSGPGPPRGFKLFPMAVVRHVNAETAAGGGGVGEGQMFVNPPQSGICISVLPVTET